jgi:hypothetical protein
MGSEHFEQLVQMLPTPNSECEDPLATTNAGQSGGCVYDCVALQQHYFPEEDSRCFLYDAAAGGWPADLLALRNVSNHRTIVIPDDENWVVQGALGLDGVPVKLDARLQSGKYNGVGSNSEASIVVRYTRFSGQSAPEDPWANINFGAPSHSGGGAFSYEGGGQRPGVHVPMVIFEHVVFDHNICGGASLQSTKGDPWMSPDEDHSGIKVIVDSCLFVRNNAANHWSSGGMSTLGNTQTCRVAGGIQARNYWPLAFDVLDSHLVENTPDQFHAAPGQGPEADPLGGAHITMSGCHVVGALSERLLEEGHDPLQDIGELGVTIGPGRSNAMDITLEDTTFADMRSAALPGWWFGYYGESDVSVRIINVQLINIQSTAGSGVLLTSSGFAKAQANVLLIGGTDQKAPYNIELRSLLMESCGLDMADTYSVAHGVVTIEGDGIQSAVIADSTFRRNKAAVGGVLLVGSGSDDAHVLVSRCSFIDNMAIVNGGAISITSVGGHHRIHDSLFLGNSVVAAPGSTAQFVLQIFTGSYGFGVYDGSVAWQIDDGPVFGLSPEECERARQISDAGVQGDVHPNPSANYMYTTKSTWASPPPSPLAPSFPTALCANVSYKPRKLQASGLELERGPHMLRVGVALRDFGVLYWRFASDIWVEIVGLGAALAPTPHLAAGLIRCSCVTTWLC